MTVARIALRTTMIPMTVDTFETRRRYIGPKVTRKPHACAGTFEALGGGVAGRGVGGAWGVGGEGGVEGGIGFDGGGGGERGAQTHTGGPQYRSMV